MSAAFARGHEANIAVLTAVTLPLLVLGVGVAVDTQNAVTAKSRLQSAADTAAITGARAAKLAEGQRGQAVRTAIEENLVTALGNDAAAIARRADVTFDDSSQTVSVRLNYSSPNSLLGIVGRDSTPVSVDTAAIYAVEETPKVSIALVLDISGSMAASLPDGRSRIDVLKSAVGDMFSAIEDNAYDATSFVSELHTGLSAFDIEVKTSVPMGTGWAHLMPTVRGFTPGSGTNSYSSLNEAHGFLVADRATRSASDTVSEFIVLMSDGDNDVDSRNHYNPNTETQRLCGEAKAQGMTIYSIAFDSEDFARDLMLECASFAPGHEDSTCNSVDDCNEERVERAKSGYFFDVATGGDFEASFSAIGAAISRDETRLVQ